MDQRGEQRRHALAKVRIVGEKASIEWWDEHPNQLSYEVQGEPARILERGMPYLSANALADDRIGGGHPEGLFEARPISIAAMRRRLTPRTVTIAPSCKTSGIRTSKPGYTASTGSSSASNRLMPAASGLTLLYLNFPLASGVPSTGLLILPTCRIAQQPRNIC